MNENLARRFESVDSPRSLRAACIEGGQMVLEAILKGQLPELESLKDLLESCDSSNPVLREFSLLQLWTVYSIERGPVGDDVVYEDRGNGIFVGSTSDDIKARAWNFAAICRMDTKKKPSRVKPDHQVTVWYRKHYKKYPSKKAAVRAFIEIHKQLKASKPLETALYNQLDNDLRKCPLKPTKKL